MSFTNIIPTVQSHLSYAQAGKDIGLRNDRDVPSHAGSTGGGSSVGYKEFIAGRECGPYTSADNTNGVLFFPEVEYWIAMHNLSKNTTSATLVEVEISAQSITGNHYSKDTLYNPASNPSNYFHLFSGDEVFGKFNRVVMYKTIAAEVEGIVLLTRGPGKG